jgi:type VI protein secretion system component Hcp
LISEHLSALFHQPKTIIMKKILLILLVFGLSFSLRVSAQIYIRAVGNIGTGATGIFDGGSQSVKHAKEIEAHAYSDGLAGCPVSGGSGTGGGACKVSKTAFTFSMPVSFAVNSFKFNLLSGGLLTSVDMVVAKSGAQPLEYYKVHMEGVKVLAISEGGTSSGEQPVFNIEIVPQKVAWQITKQNANGSLGDKFSTGWDFTTNRSFNYPF